MTDEPKRGPRPAPRKTRHHELDVEAPGHPGEPRHVVSTDHAAGWQAAESERRSRHATRERRG